MGNDLAVLTDAERAAVLLHRDAAWAFVQERRLAPQLAPVLDDVGIVLACYDAARAEVDRLTAERDAARAALDGLIQGVEHFAKAAHLAMHNDGRCWRQSTGEVCEQCWRECERGGCPGLRRAVARARAASDGGER